MVDLSQHIRMTAQGMLLGLGAAAPIGPVNIEIARRALAQGFKAGLFVGCGAVSVDIFYAALSTVVAGRLPDNPAFTNAVTLIGAAVLAFLGFMSIRGGVRRRRRNAALPLEPLADAGGGADATQAPGAGALAARARRPAVSYVTGIAMTISNPMTIAFWFFGGPATVAGAAGPLWALCVGVFLGTFAWVVAFAGALSVARRGAAGRKLWIADLLGGATLLGFAGLSIWKLRPLLL